MLMGGDTAAFNCPAQDERTRWVKGANAGPFQVAATDLETRFGYEPGEALLMKYSSFFSYGYNWYGCAHDSFGEWDLGLGEQVNLWKPFDPTGHEFPVSKVRNPSQMIAIADSTADGQSDYGIGTWYGYPQEWPGKVHSGVANVLFCDGHVQWYLQQELVPDKLSRARSLPMSRMWNNDNQRHAE
jgi:prepilin-type processing-associated H-X9-DG protein